MTKADDEELERLIEHVKQLRGFDFSGYKRPTLGRRVRKRMADIGVDTIGAYIDQLEASSEEFAALFDTVLINVSAFFRDPQVWERVARDVIPAIIAGKAPGEPIRVWSAGCASGEEPYTIAMLFAAELGRDAYRERVKIFATDIDGAALDEARRAVYEPKRLESIPQDLRERWFEPSGDGFRLDGELRRSVIFGLNDLLRDPPITRLDLLACRNTLMYFNADAQADVVRRLHLALNDDGHVILGRADMLLSRTGAFATEVPSLRIFRKVRSSSPGRHEVTFAHAGTAPPGISDTTLMRSIANGPVAQLVLDPEGRVVVASDALRRWFALSGADIGRPLRDLEISYRPADLRSLIAQATASGETARLPDPIAWRAPDSTDLELEIAVTPLRDDKGTGIGTSITFLDTTRTAHLRSELERTRNDADAAYEELQAMVEELETTNEELQSTNEELETTNEELQSTNEELETTNEELQSTNEELETTNAALEVRTDELDNVSALMGSILLRVGTGVAVVDRELRVEVWNERARDLWGVGIDDVRGKHLLNLDIGLPVGQLREPMLECVNGSSDGSTTVLAARDRRGHEVTCTVQCFPHRAPDGTPDGVVTIMEAPETP